MLLAAPEAWPVRPHTLPQVRDTRTDGLTSARFVAALPRWGVRIFRGLLPLYRKSHNRQVITIPVPRVLSCHGFSLTGSHATASLYPVF